MLNLMIHHVTLVVSDLERSVAFYENTFGLDRVERPPFTQTGAWLACGALQIHLLDNPNGSFRTRTNIDVSDLHFAFRTEDFEAVMAHLAAIGFHEDGEEGDPQLMLVRRHGVAGFPQVYLLDPDNNVIEINGAPLEQPPLWPKSGTR